MTGESKRITLVIKGFFLAYFFINTYNYNSWKISSRHLWSSYLSSKITYMKFKYLHEKLPITDEEDGFIFKRQTRKKRYSCDVNQVSIMYLPHRDTRPFDTCLWMRLSCNIKRWLYLPYERIKNTWVCFVIQCNVIIITFPLLSAHDAYKMRMFKQVYRGFFFS